MIDEVDLGRQAQRDQEDTFAEDEAYSHATYWRALRRHRLPWWLAAGLVLARARMTQFSVQLGVGIDDDFDD